MKQNQILVVSVLTGTIMVGLCLTAYAGTETFTVDYGSASNPLVIGGTDFPASLPFNKFDTSLGQLTGIEIILNTDELLQANVFNIGGPASILNAQASGTVSVTGSDGANSTVSLATTPFSGLIGSGSSQGTQVLVSGADSSSVVPTDFSDYEYSGVGSSSLDLTLAGSDSFGGTGPAGVFFGGTASAYGTAEIIYSYDTSVPETWTLWSDLGILVCGFAAFKHVSRFWDRAAVR